MSTIHVCDRCGRSLGKFYTSNERHNIHIKRINDMTSALINNIDFCDECYELFEDYLADFLAYNHSNKEVEGWCGI